MGISLWNRDIKYAVGKIRNHVILKSCTGLHIFQHKTEKYNLQLTKNRGKHTYAHKQPRTYIHIYAHIYKPMRTYAYAQIYIYIYINTYSYMLTHQVCMHISAYAYLILYNVR